LWAKFTYIGEGTTYITKLFRNTNVNATFTTNNTLGKHLAIKQGTPPQNKHEKCEIYQLICPDCSMKYA